MKRTPVTNVLINDQLKDNTYFQLCKNRSKEYTMVTFCSHNNEINSFDGKKSSSYYTVVFDFSANLVFTTKVSWCSNLTIRFAKEFIENGVLSKTTIKELTNKEIDLIKKADIFTKERSRKIIDMMNDAKKTGNRTVFFGDGLVGFNM